MKQTGLLYNTVSIRASIENCFIKINVTEEFFPEVLPLCQVPT